MKSQFASYLKNRIGISKRINRLMHNTVYFALMEERQAYAFTHSQEKVVEPKPPKLVMA